MSRAIHRTDDPGQASMRRAVVRSIARSRVAESEPYVTRGLLSRGYSWVANLIPDRVYNVTLTFMASMTAMAIGLGILSNTRPLSSSQASAATTPFAPLAPRNPLPSVLPAPELATPVIMAPTIPDIPEIQKTIAPSDLSKLGTVNSGPLQMKLRPDYQLPRFDKPYEKAAMAYTRTNEGPASGSFEYPKNKRMAGIGCYVAANIGLVTQALDCTPETAQGIADGTVSITLDPAGVDGLYGAFFNDIAKVLKQKCTNRGVDFESLPARAKIALLDISYVRPDWVNDKLIGAVKVGNYGVAAFQAQKLSDSYIDHPNQRGVARRMAMASFLFYNATPDHANRGEIDGIKYNLSAADMQYLRGLAPAEPNQVFVPARQRARGSR